MALKPGPTYSSRQKEFFKHKSARFARIRLTKAFEVKNNKCTFFNFELFKFKKNCFLCASEVDTLSLSGSRSYLSQGEFFYLFGLLQ